ncbi:MAG: PadR family transcriptional regulator [Candidatus Bathyarchaeia archaeon]|jgi:DNA-binding PadR family transcriptional regulator
MLSLENRRLEERALKKAQEKIITAYLSGIILSRLKKEQSSGYDLLLELNKDLNLSVSPGTLYSNLYSLERQGLVECRAVGRKRICKLTLRGETVVQTIQESKKMRSILFLISKEIFNVHGK